jgi:hypothetical protein
MNINMIAEARLDQANIAMTTPPWHHCLVVLAVGTLKSGMTTHHILSRFRGALRMMLSTRSRSSAASEAEDTTARFSL